MQYHFPEFHDIGLSNPAMYPGQATHTLGALEDRFVLELTKYSCASVSSRLGLTSMISTKSILKLFSGTFESYGALSATHPHLHVSEHLVDRASKHF